MKEGICLHSGISLGIHSTFLDAIMRLVIQSAFHQPPPLSRQSAGTLFSMYLQLEVTRYGPRMRPPTLDRPALPR